MKRTIGLLAGFILYLALAPGQEVSSISRPPLTGADLNSRQAPIDISDSADWHVPHGTEPVNGSQPDSTGVDLFRGDYTPSVALDALPARGGLMPDTRLVYSAQREESPLGSGWQFGFMSSIERRAPGGGTPDMYGVLDDPSAAFEFRIDGALLVPNPNGDGTYRAEHDAFTIYEPMVHWVIVNRVVAWEVRRAGITRTYGSTANVGFCEDGVDYATADCTEPVRWYLTRIENAHGNAIDIEYESFPHAGLLTLPTHEIREVLEARTLRTLESRFPRGTKDVLRPARSKSKNPLARIDEALDPHTTVPHTFPSQQIDTVFLNNIERQVITSDTHKLLPVRLRYNDDSHRIDLIYESRPDLRSERRDGIERTLGRRVSRIEVKAIRDGVEHLSHRYRLAYTQARSDGRSLLRDIHQETVEPVSGESAESILIRRFEYSDQALSALAWDGWEALVVEGKTLVPEHYEFTDEMQSHSYSSTSLLVNVDTDAEPDLIVLNTDCEADPPESPPSHDSRPGGGGGQPGDVIVDKDVIDIPRTALFGCKPHHRVFLNESYGADGRRFVYDKTRTDQLNERLGPLQQRSGPVEYLIVDIDGNGIADLLLGDVDNSWSSQAYDRRYFVGSALGWTGDGLDLPWASSLGGHDPFRELQLADVNGDGIPDLIGDEGYFLNSGRAPFFTGEDARPLGIFNTSGDLKNLPTDRPPANPASACMARGAAARFARSDLGVHRGFSSDAYQGTEDYDNALDAEDWVWRHTSYSDVNGDSVADRVVALSWPEEAQIGRDFAITEIWQDAEGRCGGVNRVYYGNGRGEFSETDTSIGGLYRWPGGPRALELGRNEVQTAPAVTFEFTPPVNHQSLVDFDGDGRAEMTQVCGSGWAHAIPDLGDGEGGFGLEPDSTVCPNGGVELPAMWNGAAGSLPPYVGIRDDSVLGGYFDVDGNGMADLFVAANPVNPGVSTKAGGTLPYWRRSTRDVSQSRLTAVIGPYGGRTELGWTMSAEGGGGARLLTVIDSITGMNGRTDFRFGAPAFTAGRFLGFQDAEAWGTSGIVDVTRFSADRRRLGAIEHEATYTEDGSLYRLTVHLDRTEAQQVSLDSVAPFFNPVVRTCSFEFENDSEEDDPASFIEECAEFGGAEGSRLLIDRFLASRREGATRPIDPARRSTSPSKGRSSAGKLDGSPRKASALNDEILFRTGGDTIRLKTGTVNTEQDLEDGPIAVLITDNRVRITEFDWEDARGVLLEERSYKDISTVDDTTVSSFTYHPWSNALAVSRLHTRQTRNVSASSQTQDLDDAPGTFDPLILDVATRRSFEYPLEDYVGTDWGREIQRWVNNLSPFLPERQRSRTRTFSRGAVVAETAWGETRVVSFAIDHCGLLATRRTALGWERIERDALCREITKETNHGRVERPIYDELHRLTEVVVELRRQGAPTQRASAARYAYDRSASLSEPTEVEIRPDDAGGETIAKSYADEFGRTWKHVVCVRDPEATDAWTNSLEQAYPCVDDAERMVTTITLYDALSGLEAFKSLPFSGAEGEARLGGTPTHASLVPAVELIDVSGTRTQHDRHGRYRLQTLPDGRTIDYAFDLGSETSTGDGVSVELRQRGVTTTVLRNGVLLSSSKTNAFDETIQDTDALGHITTHSFDQWGRRIATTTPETDVWATCDGPALRMSARERATFSDNDEVLTITDALGRVVTKRYDRHGRVTEIIGPDGVTQETRVYFDAYKPLSIPGIEPIPGAGSIQGIERGNTDFRPRTVATSDAMGNMHTVWIDALDRVYRQRAPDGTEVSISFDSLGRESRRITPTGETVAMRYDWLDRPVTLTVNSGGAIATETREYDVRGNLLRAVDADGEIRERRYDAMDRLLKETLGDPEQRKPLTIVRNSYDESGRIDESVLNGVRTAFRHDDVGRLVRKLVGYDPDADTTALMRESLTYTARDEVESSIDRRGEGIRSIYDELGRVVAKETLFNDEVLAGVETGYNLLGQPVRTVDESGDVTCYEHDEYGRTTAATLPGLGTQTTEYTRNPKHPLTGEPTLSLRTRITAPTGEITDTYVDAMGRAWLTSDVASGYMQNTYVNGRQTRS